MFCLCCSGVVALSGPTKHDHTADSDVDSDSALDSHRSVMVTDLDSGETILEDPVTLRIKPSQTIDSQQSSAPPTTNPAISKINAFSPAQTVPAQTMQSVPGKSDILALSDGISLSSESDISSSSSDEDEDTDVPAGGTSTCLPTTDANKASIYLVTRSQVSLWWSNYVNANKKSSLFMRKRWLRFESPTSLLPISMEKGG